uniref:Uncharacterized protein n=1 Tax=Arundo donax TaxID=35708 RepID=A0A0A9B255_ARUDO
MSSKVWGEKCSVSFLPEILFLRFIMLCLMCCYVMYLRPEVHIQVLHP